MGTDVSACPRLLHVSCYHSIPWVTALLPPQESGHLISHGGSSFHFPLCLWLRLRKHWNRFQNGSVLVDPSGIRGKVCTPAWVEWRRGVALGILRREPWRQEAGLWGATTLQSIGILPSLITLERLTGVFSVEASKGECAYLM